MNYQALYNGLIESRKARPAPAGYAETHHILPRALGGGDEPENLIVLAAKEHFTAHRLLAKIHGGPMVYAVQKMWKQMEANGVKITNRVYETLRKELAEIRSVAKKAAWADPEHREKVLAAMKAAHADPDSVFNSDEYRKKRGAESKARWADPEHRKKVCAAKKAAWADPYSGYNSDERNKKNSEAKKAAWADPERREKMLAAIKAAKAGPEARQKQRATRRDKAKYIFQHSAHGRVVATQHDLRMTYALNHGSLSRLVHGRLKTCNGWRFLGPEFGKGKGADHGRILSIEVDKELQVFSMDEACQALKVSRPTLLKLIKSGKLYALKPGRSWIVPRESIKAFLERK